MLRTRCRTLTTNLLFGKSGVQGYFTSYVTKTIPDSAIESGWVQQAFEDRGKEIWFLDEEGLVVLKDLQGNRLQSITMDDFIDGVIDDQAETDLQPWPEDLINWAGQTTSFDAVVVYRD